MLYNFSINAERRAGPLRLREYLAFIVAVSIFVFLFFLSFGACTALAADSVPDSRTLFLPDTQFIAALVGALVPAVTYFVNYHAPWISEFAKGVVLVAVAAVAGALTQLLDAGGIAVNWETAQVVGTAVVLALLAHFGFWKPTGASSAIGGGRNAQDERH